jgi:hypothetical protein
VAAFAKSRAAEIASMGGNYVSLLPGEANAD